MSVGFYFDNERCTGCRTCVMACKDYHNHPVDQAFRKVIDYEGGSWNINNEKTVTQSAFAYHISLACNHCDNPACVHVCPTGAMHKDEHSLVWPDVHKCVGCGYCTMACPYYAPHIDTTLKRSTKCDGCRDRLTQNKKPICVEACPLRALDFGSIEDLSSAHPDCLREIHPLPPATATRPNLLVKVSPAAQKAAEAQKQNLDEKEVGRIVNREEIGL